MEQRVVALDDLHSRLGLAETQLATARVQRVAGPTSGLLFSGLAWFWFHGEMRSAEPGSIRFFMILAFVLGGALGLVFNEFHSRRAIARLKLERQELEALLAAGAPESRLRSAQGGTTLEP